MSLIYTFRILSNEEDSFVLELKIRSEQTFLHLHEAIQKALKYDKSQMASFYLTNQNWEKEKEITLLEMSDKTKTGPLTMTKSSLKDHLKQVKDRLLYVYDFFYERALNIELIQIDKGPCDTNFPICIRLEGKIPQQILTPDLIPGDIKNIFDDDDYDDIRLESLDDLEI